MCCFFELKKKGDKKIPKTKFQDFIYTLIMVIVMVYAMVCYNVAINMGSLNNTVFLLALKELPIMGVIAFLLEFFLIGKLSQKLAFRLVNPKEDKYIFVILTISSIIVCFMCPIMSFIGSTFFGFSGIENIFSNWIKTAVLNFPMALCWQIFYAGTFVRFVFKRIFRKQLEK